MAFSPIIGSLEALCGEGGPPMGYCVEAHNQWSSPAGGEPTT